MPSDRFRAGVAAVIVNGRGQVLAFKRKNEADAWQLPQGGLNVDEPSDEGIFREVFEETGLAADHLELLGEYPVWLAYEFPNGDSARMYFRGQVHKWFLFRLHIDYGDDYLAKASDDEFDSWRWMTMEELYHKTVPFKAAVYQKLRETFADHLI